MDILDVRDLYYERNRMLYKQWLTELSPEDQNAVQLLPLIFQVNDRHLPGYVHADTPYGIFNYKPEKTEVELARKLNTRFRYQQEPVHKNAVIDAIYIHGDIFGKTINIWLFTNARLVSSHRHLLAEKLSRIGAWLRGRGLAIETRMVSTDMIVDEKELVDEGLYKIRNKYYLQKFYAESILLAGKMPVWWLVQPDRESAYRETVQYIHRARFLPDNEAIDINTLSGISHTDCLQQAVSSTQAVFNRPAINWLNLLVIYTQQRAIPDVDGAAVRARMALYGKPENLEQSLPDYVYTQIIKEISELFRQHSGGMSAENLMMQIYAYERGLPDSILKSLLPEQARALAMRRDIKKILQSYRDLFGQVRLVLGEIVRVYRENDTDKSNPELEQIARNILLFLSDSDERVPMTIPEEQDDFILEKVLLRRHDDSVWSLSINREDGVEQELTAFPQLLSLVTWGWVNHVLDNQSQVSVECPGHLVKQVEVRHVLEILMQEISINELRQLHHHAFRQLVKPFRSILFINLVPENPAPDFDIDELKDDADLLINCEQILIDSWGGVYSRNYRSDQGLLDCLCDWMNQARLFDTRPGKLTSHGYGPGNSTYIAQRTGEIYDELQVFYHSLESGRYLVRLNGRYYAFLRDAQGYACELLGNEADVRRYLEAGLPAYIHTGLDRMVLAETPLRRIYSFNRPGLVQVFYQLTGRDYQVWILDEQGSLFESRKLWYDRDTFVGQWLAFAANIGARLKKIRYQEAALPAWQYYQISISPLGDYEFETLRLEGERLRPDYFDLKLYIVGASGGDQISVRCDDAYFDYAEFGGDVINQCIRYMNRRIHTEGRKPAYVTDIEAPLRLFRVEERDQIQYVHFMKYKQAFERRINQLLR